jgi:hypothetical protein
MPGANVAANGGVSSSTDSRHKDERSGPPQRIACSARISRRRSDRRQASVQQDAPPLRHSDDRKRRRRRRTLWPICSSQTSGAPKPAGAEPAPGPPHPEELFDALRNSGFDVGPGDLGENITTAGLDLETLPSTHSFASALRRTFGSPASARPACSSIASSPD